MNNNCDKELISAYLDGELSEPEETSVRLHLSECSECQAWYATFQRNRKALQRHPQIAPSSLARERLARRLDNEVLITSRRIKALARRRLAFALAAAAAILVLVAGIFVITSMRDKTDKPDDIAIIPQIKTPETPPEPKEKLPVPDSAPKEKPEWVKTDPETERPQPVRKDIPEPEEPKKDIVVTPKETPKPVVIPEERPKPKPETPRPSPYVSKDPPKTRPDDAPKRAPDQTEQQEKERAYAAAEEKLDRGFAEENPKLQIEAIQSLAKIDTPKTYKKLSSIIILGDKRYNIRVRRQGIMACGELSTEEGVRIIFEVPSSDSPAVLDARHEALALIRDNEKTLKLLANALKPGDTSIKFATPDGRRLIAVALGNSGAAFTAETILDAFRNTPVKQIELRSAMITALGNLRHPIAVEELGEILTSAKKDTPRIYLRMLAAEALGRINHSLSEDTLLKAMDRSQPEGIKVALTRALGRTRTGEAVGPIIKQLSSRSNRLRSASFEALGMITGESFTSASRWKKWWKKVKQEYEAPLGIEPGVPSRAFFRIEDFPLYVENVVFVVNYSSSMEKNGKALQLLADMERAINSLDKSAQFNVICFSEQMRQLKPKLIPVTYSNKRAAIEFCKRWVGKPASLGPSNAARALRAAVALQPDLSVYASDGLSAGEESSEKSFPTVTARKLVRELGWDRRGPKLKRPRIYVMGYFVPKGKLARGATPKGETARALRILADDTSGLFRYGWFTDILIAPEDRKGLKPKK
jgi:HEAT repeat protein